MRAIVFSDTHRQTSRMFKILEGSDKKIDMVIHLGDCIRDCEELRRSYPDMGFEAVGGNNDPYSYEHKKIIAVKGHRLLLTHGHTYRVKWGDLLLKEAAKKESCEAVLFGHTHRPVLEYFQGVLFFNPGSLSLPVKGRPTYGILDITPDNIKAQIVEF